MIFILIQIKLKSKIDMNNDELLETVHGNIRGWKEWLLIIGCVKQHGVQASHVICNIVK
jgi:hypothetical protein